MPFAGYKDFQACLDANRDKDSPEAYCGSIKHKVEDKSLDAAVALAELGAAAAELVAKQRDPAAAGELGGRREAEGRTTGDEPRGRAGQPQSRGRTYLAPGEKPPKGAKVGQGPRGGRYYEGGPAGGGKPEGGLVQAPSGPGVGSFKDFQSKHGVVMGGDGGMLEVRDRGTGALVARQRLDPRQGNEQITQLMRDAYRKVVADEAKKEVGRRRGDFGPEGKKVGRFSQHSDAPDGTHVTEYEDGDLNVPEMRLKAEALREEGGQDEAAQAVAANIKHRLFVYRGYIRSEGDRGKGVDDIARGLAQATGEDLADAYQYVTLWHPTMGTRAHPRRRVRSVSRPGHLK